MNTALDSGAKDRENRPEEERAARWQSLLDHAQAAPTEDGASEILLAGGYPEDAVPLAAAVLYNHGELKSLPPKAGSCRITIDPRTGELRRHTLTAEETAEFERAWVLYYAPDGTDLRFYRMKKSLGIVTKRAGK